MVLALQDFNGAIILIAHDRYLLESCVDEFYLVANGQVSEFSGDIDDYQQWLNDEKKHSLQSTKNSAKNSSSTTSSVDKKQQRQQQAELRKIAAPLKKQAQQYEKKVQQWQTKLAEVESILGESEIYQTEHKTRLADLMKEQGKLKQNIEENEMLWLELEEQIEEIMSQQ